jgi:hypothetical protein
MISSQGQPIVDGKCSSRMMPRICVQSEQQTLILECGLDETLLSAALRAGVGVATNVARAYAAPAASRSSQARFGRNGRTRPDSAPAIVGFIGSSLASRDR